MKVTRFIAVIGVLAISIAGCEKYAEDYKTFLEDKELTYPGLAQGFSYHPGDQRVELIWRPSPDPSIVKYVFTWNNGADSVTVPATSNDPADTMKVIIDNLQEYVYSFKMTIYDAGGNPSIGQELNNVKVYGTVYRSSLLNRSYNDENPYEFTTEGYLKLNFNKADTNVLSRNTSTTIRYTNTLGVVAEKLLPADDPSIIIQDYKTGTVVRYRSSYKPSPTAIDEFQPNDFEEFPEIVKIVPVNKASFSEMHLPGDVGSAYGWELRYIWDDNTGEPGFHTPGQEMPFWFTFDMAQEVSLASLKLWQRQSGIYNYGNPKRFEVWGSNNPSPDGSWDSWTRLQEFTNVKPSGQPLGENSSVDVATAAAGEEYVFDQPTSQYRYLRFKILECWNGNYFHIVELSLYKKE